MPRHMFYGGLGHYLFIEHSTRATIAAPAVIRAWFIAALEDFPISDAGSLSSILTASSADTPSWYSPRAVLIAIGLSEGS